MVSFVCVCVCVCVCVKGEGSLTDSGYPRVVLEWKRGTPLSDATKVYEGQKEDVSVNGYW